MATPAVAKVTCSKETQDKLVLDHLEFARCIALGISKCLPIFVDKEDLIHAGIIGLLDAATRFSPDHGEFKTFAKKRVKGAIIDYIRDRDWASRDTRRFLDKVEQGRKELLERLQYEPSNDEIFNWLQIDCTFTQKQLLQKIQHISIDGSFIVNIPCRDAQPEVLSNQNKLAIVIKKSLKRLHPRYRKAIELYFMEEMTMVEIGKKMGINESRVSQIIRRAIQQLRVLFEERGYTENAFIALSNTYPTTLLTARRR